MPTILIDTAVPLRFFTEFFFKRNTNTSNTQRKRVVLLNITKYLKTNTHTLTFSLCDNVKEYEYDRKIN